MMKRNDGYTLAYVMVILFVLASVALATMGLALQPAKNQATALKRMQDKYTAQGLAEQVVAQLEHADAETLENVLGSYVIDAAHPDRNPYCEKINVEGSEIYKLVAKSGKTTVTAEFTLEQRTKNEPTGENAEDGTPITTTTIIGHTVKYISYKTEVAQ
ncbi:MAG: hypothetical protein IJA67_09950 [Oscillospiraceae bacterium]|nr:hypothetical protein [Oscillospiraceae bacterium]